MRARAPGKLVLSGAYAVLRGAPALVTAISRFAEADASRPASFVTPEVAEALQELESPPEAPWFDASRLRERDAKLGLGSSAAILVASLGAVAPPGAEEGETEWRQRIYERALRAHRRAQGGGSGVDVAAATFGGTLLARLDPRPDPDGDLAPALHLSPVPFPPDLQLEVWALGQPASTRDFLRAVFALEAARPREFEGLLGAQSGAAWQAARALEAGNTGALLDGLRAQFHALHALGEAAGVPIVVDAAHALARHVPPDAVLLPAGAGGGDISIYAGTGPSTPAFRAAAAQQGMWVLDATCGAEGLHVPVG